MLLTPALRAPAKDSAAPARLPVAWAGYWPDSQADATATARCSPRSVCPLGISRQHCSYRCRVSVREDGRPSAAPGTPKPPRIAPLGPRSAPFLLRQTPSVWLRVKCNLGSLLSPP